MQCGTTFQKAIFLCLPKDPCQAENINIWMTVIGITQWRPNKQNTTFHSSKAIGQWRSRWSTVSPHFLHMQHQSKINIHLFQRLLIVRIFPRATVQEKKATLDGTFDHHTICHGNDMPLVPEVEDQNPSIHYLTSLPALWWNPYAALSSILRSTNRNHLHLNPYEGWRLYRSLLLI